MPTLKKFSTSVRIYCLVAPNQPLLLNFHLLRLDRCAGGLDDGLGRLRRLCAKINAAGQANCQNQQGYKEKGVKDFSFHGILLQENCWTFRIPCIAG